MPLPKQRIFLAALSLHLASIATPSFAAQEFKSATGLPTYPNLVSALLVRHERYNGNYYDDFKQETQDSVATVEHWYRRRLRGACTTKTVGDYAGIQFIHGRDIIWIYNFSGAHNTSIEAMKYLGPAR